MSRENNLFNIVNLHGEGTFRGVTLALPVEQVRRFVPAGLALGAQSVTAPGTHPVILSFNSLYHAEMSVPTLLPSLTYHEFTFGVPYTMLRPGPIGRLMGSMLGRGGSEPQGPYYYMPQLFLDSVLATMGGILYWGYTKRLARFKVDAGRFAIDAENGAPQISLSHEPAGEVGAVTDYPFFAPVQAMLAQPLVSQLPASMGPIYVVADFDKRWHEARLQPLTTSVRVEAEFVPGFGVGAHPDSGSAPSIADSVLGSYELNAPWLLGMPHAPLLR